MAEGLRLDHYLFRARLFKSRSKATSVCKEGKVQINGDTAKSSSSVNEGDLIRIREKGLYREIRVLELPGKNMSKEDARTTWRDETPQEVVEQRELIAAAARVKGPRHEGPRPTKKERRSLDKIRGR